MDPIEQNVQPSGLNKKYILIAGVIVVLLGVLAYLLYRSNQVKEQAPISPEAKNEEQRETKTVNPIQAAVASPQVSFESWDGIAETTSYPSTAPVYQFKSNLSFDEAAAMLEALGFDAHIQTQGTTVVGYAADEGDNAAVGAVDLKNGSLAYNSTSGVPLPQGSSLDTRVAAFLQTLGLYDRTLTVGAQYKSRQHPGKTFVEIHRDWKRAGLPILNPIGLLNIPETQSLATLSLDTVNKLNGADINIYATTDNSDGYIRSDDFNTITLGISDTDQTVTFIKSSIRPLAQTTPNSSSLISYEEAFAKAESAQYEFIYTSPSGSGESIPWETIYENNLAHAQVAKLQEAVVAYLETNPEDAQESLMPYYVFKGSAELSSGYRVIFIAGVPAVKTTTSRSLIPVAYAQDDTGQKQGTFEMGPQVTTAVYNQPNQPYVPPIAPGQPIPPIVNNQSVCNPSVNDFEVIIEYSGMYFGYGWRFDHKQKSWHYIPTAGNLQLGSALAADLPNIINMLKIAVVDQNRVSGVPDQNNAQMQQNQLSQNLADSPAVPTVFQTNDNDTGQKQSTFYVPTVAQTTRAPVQTIKSDLKIRELQEILGDINKNVSYCPLRLTGGSPSLFVYAPENTTVSVEPKAKLTYSDPSLLNTDSWTFRNGNINGSSRSFAYYEYTDVRFNRPNAGWNVTKADIQTFVTEVIAPSLGLTADETARAEFEISHAARTLKEEKLFIGLIDQKLVNSAIPLHISPQPDALYRYFFYVGAQQGSAEEPNLTPIVRQALTVVEIGSYTKQ